MLLDFQRGESTRPRGHALAYYRDALSADDIYATYLIVPPIAIDLAKYMPPLFADKISLADMESISAVPLPPVPEKVESLAYLQRLAETRDDDIVFLGTMQSGDVHSVLRQVAEAAQSYLRSYETYIGTMPAGLVGPEPAALSGGVDDVLYSLMNDRDKLAELAKLVGKLRYAVDGNDSGVAAEAVAEMEALGAHLPDKYHVEAVVAAAKLSGEKGSRLSELQITRCYKLCDEDYLAVERLEREIGELEG